MTTVLSRICQNGAMTMGASSLNGDLWLFAEDGGKANLGPRTALFSTQLQGSGKVEFLGESMATQFWEL